MEGVRSSLYNGHDNRKSPNTGSNVQELWGEFLCATVYIRNRILTAQTNTTPYEKFFGKKPSVDHLRALGCQAKVLTPSELRRKLDPTSENGWLVGYCENTKGWRVWNPQTRKIIISRDVIFDETTFIGDEVINSASEVKHNPCEPFRVVLVALEANQRVEHAINEDQGPQEQNEDVDADELMDEEAPALVGGDTHDGVIENELPDEQATVSVPTSHDYFYRTRSGKPYGKSLGLAAQTSAPENTINNSKLEVDEPQSFREAQQSKYADKWMAAFEEEYKSQMDNKSWELVPPSELPPGCIPIRHKWIGRYKPGYGDIPPRFKGRLTAVGCAQRPGIDFEDTFAPVPRTESFRMFMSVVASENLEMVQIDIKTAFLNADLDKPIFMTQPEGFLVPGKEDWPVLLKKALYGTKRAPMLWNKTFKSKLEAAAFKPLTADGCVYIRVIKEEVSLLIVYVDDVIYASNKSESLKTFVDYMASEFEIRNLPPHPISWTQRGTQQTRSSNLYLTKIHRSESTREIWDGRLYTSPNAR
jgi:hypothetical protein